MLLTMVILIMVVIIVVIGVMVILTMDMVMVVAIGEVLVITHVMSTPIIMEIEAIVPIHMEVVEAPVIFLGEIQHLQILQKKAVVEIWHPEQMAEEMGISIVIEEDTFQVMTRQLVAGMKTLNKISLHQAEEMVDLR